VYIILCMHRMCNTKSRNVAHIFKHLSVVFTGNLHTVLPLLWNMKPIVIILSPPWILELFPPHGVWKLFLLTPLCWGLGFASWSSYLQLQCSWDHWHTTPCPALRLGLTNNKWCYNNKWYHLSFNFNFCLSSCYI
jgi:hypothetical protein